jgi:hypothetical protein
MADSGVAAIVLAFIVVGAIVTYVTGDWIFWPILLFSLAVGVAIANDLLGR